MAWRVRTFAPTTMKGPKGPFICLLNVLVSVVHQISPLRLFRRPTKAPSNDRAVTTATNVGGIREIEGDTGIALTKRILIVRDETTAVGVTMRRINVQLGGISGTSTNSTGSSWKEIGRAHV